MNRLDQPLALGYSSAGTIIQTGPGLRGFRTGDRVACAGGGPAVHAEFAAVPQNLMVHVPDGVSLDEAALLVAMHADVHQWPKSKSEVERVIRNGLWYYGEFLDPSGNEDVFIYHDMADDPGDEIHSVVSIVISVGPY